MDSIDIRFAQLRAAGLPGQLCLTWCDRQNIEGIARVFGADMRSGQMVQPDEIEDLEEEYPGELLQLIPLNGWVIVLEPDGFQGIRDEVLLPLSRGGKAISIHWNVEQDSTVKYCVNGNIATAFDLTDVDTRWGQSPDALDELLERIGLRNDLSRQQVLARSLALAEVVSKQPIPDGWLVMPRFAFTITDPRPDAMVPTKYLNPRMPFLDEPEFIDLLSGPSVSSAPTIIRMIAEVILPQTALEPHLKDELTQLVDGGELRPGERDSLRDRLLDRVGNLRRSANEIRSSSASMQSEAASRLESEADATFVLAETLHAEPHVAAPAATAVAVNLTMPLEAQARMNVLRNIVVHIEYDMRHL